MVIYLIGMMGCGKTTVGNLLAMKLTLHFLDTDEFIEKKCQLPITEIIANYGINYFRNLEHQLLVALQNSYDIVVSTGGGVVLNEDNIVLMKKNGKVIYLKTSVDVLMKRLNLHEQAKRPLLQKFTLEEIYEYRKELYEKASDVIIDCDNLSIEEVCQEIINIL